MTLAVIVTDRDNRALCDMIATLLPSVLIQQWPEITEPERVEFAVLWKHPHGITQKFPNLKAVTSLGAGTDHMDSDEALSGVVQHRIVVNSLKQLMSQYVLLHILSQTRHQWSYYMNQHAKRWQVLDNDEPMKTIGFIGLGKIGRFVADRCSDLGFKTVAWTSGSVHSMHPCFHGEAGLQQVISSSDFVVLLLPLNQRTQHIISKKTLTWFKREAVLINVSRGGHVDETALISALRKGQLKHAVLDVFEAEPLTQDSTFWELENVTITPHVSARSDVKETAEAIVSLFNADVLRHSKA